MYLYIFNTNIALAYNSY